MANPIITLPTDASGDTEIINTDKMTFAKGHADSTVMHTEGITSYPAGFANDATQFPLLYGDASAVATGGALTQITIALPNAVPGTPVSVVIGNGLSNGTASDVINLTARNTGLNIWLAGTDFTPRNVAAGVYKAVYCPNPASAPSGSGTGGPGILYCKPTTAPVAGQPIPTFGEVLGGGLNIQFTLQIGTVGALTIDFVDGKELNLVGSVTGPDIAAIEAAESGTTTPPSQPTQPSGPTTPPTAFAFTAATLAAVPAGLNTNLNGLRLLPDAHPIFATGLGQYTGSAAIMALVKPLHFQVDHTMPINYGPGPSVTQSSAQLYASVSDEVGMMANPVIEDGGDQHSIWINTANGFLVETFDDENPTQVGSIAAYDLLNFNGLRPDEWGSADAAGLPIAPLVVKWNDVALYANAVGGPQPLPYPLRMTFANALTMQGFLHPATHFASTNVSGIPFGARFILDPASPLAKNIANYTIYGQTILLTLMKYGVFNADNGTNGFLTCDTNVNGWQGIYLQNGATTSTYNNGTGAGTPTAFANGAGVFMNDEFHSIFFVDPATGTNNFYVSNPTDGGLITESGASDDSAAKITNNGNGTFAISGATGAYIYGLDPVRLTANANASVTLAKGQTLCAYSAGQAATGPNAGGDEAGIATTFTA